MKGLTSSPANGAAWSRPDGGARPTSWLGSPPSRPGSPIRQVQEAADAGADSVLVMTPTTLARGRDDAVLRFYRTIADMSPLPVYLYSVPGVTGYNLPIELVWRLSRHEKVVGMKDSSGDVVRLQSIIDATPPDFTLYLGILTGAHRGHGCRLLRGDHRIGQLPADPGPAGHGRRQGQSGDSPPTSRSASVR